MNYLDFGGFTLGIGGAICWVGILLAPSKTFFGIFGAGLAGGVGAGLAEYFLCI